MGDTIANTQPNSHKKEPDFKMETQNVYTKWGLPLAAKGSFSGSNRHRHRVQHVENPPYSICALQSDTQGKKWETENPSPHPLCSRLCFWKRPKNSAISLLLFLSPLTLKLLYSSIATFRALKHPKLTFERPKTSCRLTYCVVTSHCTLGIPTFFAISHTFSLARESKPREVGFSNIVMMTYQRELSQKDIGMCP